MIRILFILVKKEMNETLGNKKKLLPFMFTLLPIFMFFYTKGSESLLDIRISVYFIPIFIINIISMQYSSTSLLNEKNSKMLDVILAMKVSAILIVLAKNIYSAGFGIITGLGIILTMKIGSIYILGEDYLKISLGYFILMLVISYLSSVISFLTSLIVHEISVIPIIATTANLLVIVTSLKIIAINNVNLLSESSMWTTSILFLLLNIIFTLINTKYIRSKKFLTTI